MWVRSSRTSSSAARSRRFGRAAKKRSKSGIPIPLERIFEHGHRTGAGISRERIVTGILLPYADRPGPDEAERYCEGAEQARLAIELDAHRQPPKQLRVSRESEHQLQALRTSN
jgi:hypothetical protein